MFVNVIFNGKSNSPVLCERKVQVQRLASTGAVQDASPDFLLEG